MRINNLLIFLFSISFIALVFFKCNPSSHQLKSTQKIITNYKDSTFTNLSIALEKRDSVYSLQLREKKILHFPLEVLNFPNLEYLDLSMNDFTSIPIEVQELKNLQFLIITHGKIKTIPNSICNISNLKEINFLYNHIEIIPNCISKMPSLESINFNGNKINSIPLDLHLMPKLKTFCVRTEDTSFLSKETKEYLNKNLKHCRLMY